MWKIFSKTHNFKHSVFSFFEDIKLWNGKCRYIIEPSRWKLNQSKYFIEIFFYFSLVLPLTSSIYQFKGSLAKMSSLSTFNLSINYFGFSSHLLVLGPRLKKNVSHRWQFVKELFENKKIKLVRLYYHYGYKLYYGIA